MGWRLQASFFLPFFNKQQIWNRLVCTISLFVNSSILSMTTFACWSNGNIAFYKESGLGQNDPDQTPLIKFSFWEPDFGQDTFLSRGPAIPLTKNQKNLRIIANMVPVNLTSTTSSEWTRYLYSSWTNPSLILAFCSIETIGLVWANQRTDFVRWSSRVARAKIRSAICRRNFTLFAMYEVCTHVHSETPKTRHIHNPLLW